MKTRSLLFLKKKKQKDFYLWAGAWGGCIGLGLMCKPALKRHSLQASDIKKPLPECVADG
jgi:hypothetical protein